MNTKTRIHSRGVVATMLIILICIIGYVLTGCTSSSDGDEPNMQTVYVSPMTEVYDFVDPDTGVHYLVYKGYEKGGITPRYNADGTLMVTDVSKPKEE